MNRREVFSVLAHVAAKWPKSFTIPDDEAGAELHVALWEKSLGDLDVEPVMAAVELLGIEGREFAPNPDMLRSKAVSLTQPGGPPPSFDAAWEEVMRAVRTVGYTKTTLGVKIEWSHPDIEAAVRSMGWQELCESTNPGVDRAQFQRIYESRVTRSAVDAAMPNSVRALLEAAVTATALEPAKVDPDLEALNNLRQHEEVPVE